MAVARHYYCGAKVDSNDDRDRKKVYIKAEAPTGSRKPTVDLRGYIHMVYNQGELSSCTANALCAAYALDLVKQPGFDYFNPSRLFLYYNTRDYEGTTQTDDGASIRDTIKALNRKGVCKEADWPYETSKFHSKPPCRCYDSAQGNNLYKYERLTHWQDIDQLKACLMVDNCPFVFGFKVYDSFYSIKRDGKMPIPSHQEKTGKGHVGRHAVVAVGYNDHTRCITVLNSWGEEWGDGGYFYMPYSFITDFDMCFGFWKITFAFEKGKP